MFSNYSDSSYYEPTYSGDERIAASLKKSKQRRQQKLQEIQQRRAEFFEEIWTSRDLELFYLPGMTVLTLRSDKIKFTFVPSELTNYVSKKVKFHVSLRYQNGFWRVKRDNLPVNYQWRVYRLFYDEHFFAVTDENVFSVLERIYKLLHRWTLEHQEFRLEKFRRYRQGLIEDLDLDTDDEEIFLTDEEKARLHEKRKKILKRMLPPLPHPPTKTQRRVAVPLRKPKKIQKRRPRVYRVPDSSDSSLIRKSSSVPMRKSSSDPARKVVPVSVRRSSSGSSRKSTS